MSEDNKPLTTLAEFPKTNEYVSAYARINRSCLCKGERTSPVCTLEDRELLMDGRAFFERVYPLHIEYRLDGVYLRGEKIEHANWYCWEKNEAD